MSDQHQHDNDGRPIYPVIDGSGHEAGYVKMTECGPAPDSERWYARPIGCPNWIGPAASRSRAESMIYAYFEAERRELAASIEELGEIIANQGVSADTFLIVITRSDGSTSSAYARADAGRYPEAVDLCTAILRAEELGLEQNGGKQ